MLRRCPGHLQAAFLVAFTTSPSGSISSSIASFRRARHTARILNDCGQGSASRSLTLAPRTIASQCVFTPPQSTWHPTRYFTKSTADTLASVSLLCALTHSGTFFQRANLLSNFIAAVFADHIKPHRVFILV